MVQPAARAAVLATAVRRVSRHPPTRAAAAMSGRLNATCRCPSVAPPVPGCIVSGTPQPGKGGNGHNHSPSRGSDPSDLSEGFPIGGVFQDVEQEDCVECSISEGQPACVGRHRENPGSPRNEVRRLIDCYDCVTVGGEGSGNASRPGTDVEDDGLGRKVLQEVRNEPPTFHEPEVPAFETLQLRKPPGIEDTRHLPDAHLPTGKRPLNSWNGRKGSRNPILSNRPSSLAPAGRLTMRGGKKPKRVAARFTIPALFKAARMKSGRILRMPLSAFHRMPGVIAICA